MVLANLPQSKPPIAICTLDAPLVVRGAVQKDDLFKNSISNKFISIAYLLIRRTLSAGYADLTQAGHLGAEVGAQPIFGFLICVRDWELKEGNARLVARGNSDKLRRRNYEKGGETEGNRPWRPPPPQGEERWLQTWPEARPKYFFS